MAEISKKVQESRLKWYGHVMRREEEYLGKRVTVMDVERKAEVEADGQHHVRLDQEKGLSGHFVGD